MAAIALTAPMSPSSKSPPKQLGARWTLLPEIPRAISELAFRTCCCSMSRSLCLTSGLSSTTRMRVFIRSFQTVTDRANPITQAASQRANGKAVPKYRHWCLSDGTSQACSRWRGRSYRLATAVLYYSVTTAVRHAQSSLPICSPKPTSGGLRRGVPHDLL